MDPYRVDTVRINHDIVFLPGSATLDPIGHANLRSFVSQVGVQPGDAISIVASGPFALVRENAVAGALANMGIESLTLSDGNVGFDQVTVSLTRTHYLPTACLRGGVPHFNPGVITPPPGCAVATNLAAMIENPNDLLVGRETGPVDGVTAVRAVNRYRTGAVAALNPFGL
jgi:pilus biogenesis lipoprotein CpaD